MSDDSGRLPLGVTLPPLRGPGEVWYLPLSDDAAGQLIDLLLDPDPAAAGPALRRALASDAVLLLWTVCRAGMLGAELRTVREAAEWLADCLLDVLQWDEHDRPPAGLPAAAWFERNERARRLAERAGQETARSGGDRPAAEQAQLVGLLLDAPQWLADGAATAGRTDAERPGPRCLPHWLTERLKEVADPGMAERGVVAAAVAAAIGAEPAAGHEPAGRAVDLRARRAHCDRLPRLSRRLARLASLENDFRGAVEREKLASIARLAYGASHEINNPLANISSRAQTLLRDETDPERRRMLATINAQAFRAFEMIADLMLFAKPPQLRPAVVDVRELVERVLAELAEWAGEQQTVLEARVDGALTVAADASQLQPALRSLVRNALEAVRSGGLVEIAAERVVAAGDGWLEITVADTGPGVPHELRGRLFDPLFSGREAGRGLGLGLSKCWRVARLHGGDVWLDDAPRSAGARFVMRLPGCPQPEPHATPAACAPQPAGL